MSTELEARVVEAHALSNGDVLTRSTVDMLGDIFRQQRELTARYAVPTDFDFSRPLSKGARAVLQHALEGCANALIHEAVELRDWLPWKHWSERPGNKCDVELWSQEHLEELRTEVVDALHFVVEAALVLGLDAQELHRRYCGKAKVNHERQDASGY